MNRIAVNAFVVCLCSVWYGPVSAQDLPNLAEVIAVRENAERIRLGQYNANGTLSISSRNGNEERYTELIEGAFDFDDDRLAFHRVRKQLSGDPNSRFATVPDARIVRTPEFTLFARGATVGSEIEVVIHPPGHPMDRAGFIEPLLNVRCMSIVPLKWLTLNCPEMFAFVEKSQPSQEEQSDGVVRFDVARQLEGGARERYSWWCDPKQGSQVVRFEANAGRYGAPYSVSQTKWTQYEDVWVPKTFEIEGNRGNTKVKLQLEFQWTSVNQPLSETNFSWRSWNLPLKSRVIDARMGPDKAIQIERIGDELERDLPLPGSSVTRIIFITISVIAIGGVTGWLIARWVARVNARKSR
jgi:hypothetical protein